MRLVDADLLHKKYRNWLLELKSDLKAYKDDPAKNEHEIIHTTAEIEAIECCIAELESAPTIYILCRRLDS